MGEKYNALAHIRSRPGMYIGSIDHSGFNELIYYLIQDFIKAETHEITFSLKENNRLIIECVPSENTSFILDAIKNINHYNNEHFYLSIAGIIALADTLTIEINDSLVLHSKKGVCEIVSQITDDVNTIKLDFTADKDIFKDLNLSYQHLNSLLRRFSFLNAKLKIKSIDESTDELQINIFHYPKGLSEIIDFELVKNFRYDSPFFKLNFNKKTNFSYSLSLAFVGGWSLKPKIKVYANYKETILGGSLLDGILQGFRKFLKEEALKKNLNLNISNAKLKKHLLLYASVNGDLSYLGSTRWKLGTPKVQSEIKEFIYQELKSYFTDKENTITDILNALQDQ
jgi:DNA gyrase/topoisomerase IV subunit B